MFIAQLLFFIVALTVFEVYTPGPARHSWLQSVGGELAILAFLYGLFYILAKRSARQSALQMESLVFKGQVLSLGGLLFFFTYLDFKALIYQVQIIRQWEILSALIVSILFFIHLGIIWLACRGAGKNAGLASRLMLILPMVFPWYLLAISRDLLLRLWSGGRDFVASEIGYFTFMGLLIILMILCLPPLLKTWWRCKPLQQPAKDLVDEVLQQSKVKVGGVLSWNVLGSQALSAAMLGILPRLRYLLVTPKLVEVLTPTQLKAVVAHEAGHARYRHIHLYLLLFISYLLVLFCLSEPLNIIINGALYFMAGTKWGVELMLSSNWEQGYWNIAFAIPMLVVLILYLRFVLGFFMRHLERQADFFALDFMHNPAPLADALERIAQLSGNVRKQPSWHHFSIAQRSQALYEAPVGSAARKQGKFLTYAALGLALMIVLMGAGNWYLQHKNISEEIRQATLTRMQENPDNYMAQYLLAHQQWTAGHQEQAIKMLKEIEREQPGNPVILNDLAWLLLTAQDTDLQEPDLALALARRAIEVNPSSAAFWDTLALACYVNNDYIGALNSARQAIKHLHPGDDVSYFEQRLHYYEKVFQVQSHE